MDMSPSRPRSYPKESMRPYVKSSLISMMSLLILLSLLPLNAVWATTASISISGNEGLITLTASASFSTYTQCTPPGSTNCINVNSGTLYVYQNGTLMQRVSGPGSVNWSTTMDGGSMGQGEYTFTASAVDSIGESSSQTTSITIDNTPVVTVVSPGMVHGAFDIFGTIEFKERVGGNEGSIEIYIDTTAFGSYYGLTN
jgi:hypothetical protein